MYTHLALLSTLILSTTAQSTTGRFSNSTGTGIGGVRSSTTTTATSNNGTPTIAVPVGYASGWAGSIVAADACATTIVLHCTDDSNAFCAYDTAGVISVTNHASGFEEEYITSTALGGVTGKVTVSNSCSMTAPLASASQAACNVLVAISVAGTSTTKNTDNLLGFASATDSLLGFAQVPITAGASLLPSGSQKCTDTGNAAAPRATGIIREVCKVMVPIGAAAVAGALF